MRFFRLAALAISLCFFARSSAAEDVLLRISLHKSANDPIGQNLLEFKQEVEAATKGAVKIDIYDNARFYLDYQVPEAVSSGAIEMGVAPLAQYSEEIPAAGVFMQPFLFNFDAIVRAAAARGSVIRDTIDAEISKQTGSRVLWWQPYGPNVIFAKGAISSPETMANRKVRVFDEVSAEFVSLCGGIPHIISDAKQTEAFDQHIVDLSIASIASIRDYELWRKTDTITNIRHSENLFLVLINKSIWESLTPEQQQIVTTAARKAEDRIWAKFKQIVADTYSYAAQKGVKIQQLTPDDVIAWRVCSSSILESYMTRAGALGAKLFAAYGKLRTDPCCSSQANEANK
ncbi:MAG TPA: TRAP transporter substrate-binding protein DctP [Hyphomicrobiales bacterium]|nr:TRAP transporter substrate-binding protein DctP [Hyphomicrobiales bacterium]